MPWTLSGSRRMVADAHPRVERAYGSWNMIWKSRRAAPQVAVVQLGDVVPVETDRSRGGLLERHHEPPDRRLATARLAHEAERLALANGEGHVGDGLDTPDLALQTAPAVTGKFPCTSWSTSTITLRT